jgi:hypothetical protein
MPIKTFRGLIKDQGQDTINLHTPDGSMGYRIVKFQIFFTAPGSDSQDSVVQIWKSEQAAVPATPDIDFSDQNLLAVGQLVQAASVLYQTTTGPIIFDREIFNQDIYVTHIDSESAYPCNYYIELEQVRLDLNENTVATLKDIRNTAQ